MEKGIFLGLTKPELKKIAEIGESLFFKPQETYPWEEMINGIKIKQKIHPIVGGNT